MYLALVRPNLEYGQQASSPYLQRDIAVMERIQHLATNMVEGMRELPYEERLRRLNLFSLERRRLCGDLILACNIFHGRLDFSQAEFFEAPAKRNLRGHDFKIRHRSFRLMRRKAAYSVRLPGRWKGFQNCIFNRPEGRGVGKEGLGWCGSRGRRNV